MRFTFCLILSLFFIDWSSSNAQFSTSLNDCNKNLIGTHYEFITNTNSGGLTLDLSAIYKNLRNYLTRKTFLSDAGEQKYILSLNAKVANLEKEIMVLEIDNNVSKFASKNNKLLLILSLPFAIFFMAAYWIYLSKNKNLMLQKELNYQQQLKELAQAQQLNSAMAMLQGEEKERKRIAQELHDGLGGILAEIKMSLSTINIDDKKSNDEITRVQEQVDYSLVELRRIARNMMPASLLKFGLETSLKDLCHLHKSQNLQVEHQFFQVSDTINEEKQLLIYRIVQELFSNAIKHAKASLILLQCSQNVDTFLLTFEDNGKGFDENLLAEKKGMGYLNIQNRVTFLNGSVEITSAINRGTTINIELDVAG